MPILLDIAFLTLVEWKFLGYTQLWKGPNVIGPYSLLQTIGDALKLLIKEALWSATSSGSVCILEPIFALNLV